jgi:hypothetical protein
VPVATQEQVKDGQTTTLVTSLTAIGAGLTGLFVKQRVDHKKVKREGRATDWDLYEYVKLNNTIWARWRKNKTMTIDQILDMPLDQREDSLDKTTISQAMAKYESEWDSYMNKKITAENTGSSEPNNDGSD